jgi:hypothetical protein
MRKIGRMEIGTISVPMDAGKTILSAAVVLLTAAGLLNLYQNTETQAAQGDPYQIDTQLTRMQQAAASLPERARVGYVVGYVTDMDVSSARGLLAFNAARYALAPRLLVPGTSPAVGSDDAGWVLGNFSQPIDFQAFGAQRGLTFARDLGDGVVLYKRALHQGDGK